LSRPFDEARYRGLLEGLEVAEARWSTLNEELRYEAEFFQQRYLHEDTALSRLPKNHIGEFAHVTDGPHGYHVVDEASPIVMLTAKNAKNWFSEREGADPIAEWVDDANKRSSLAEGDIILSTRGSVGMCALITEETLPANIDQDVARISWHDKQAFIPGFVVAYLNSTYGQDHISRYASGMVQQGLSLQKVREIPIPALSSATQSDIAHVVSAALDLRRQASSLIQQAEQTLLHTLGLENWQPPEPLTYTRPSREAFAAGRLDAEYFAPRVAELLNCLNRDGLTLGGVAPARHERFVPNSALPSPTGGGAGGEGATANLALPVNQPAFPLPSPPPRGEGTQPRDAFEYIEIGGVRADGTAVSETVPLAEAPSRATWLVRSGDVITSTVRPIRRLSALVAPEQDGHVCSSGFVVLRPVAIPAEVLLTYLRLPPVCELLDLHTSASLYPAISEADLLAMPMPRIDTATQAQVVAAVRAAQACRRRAAELLDAAKRAVEIAIEDSEAAALAWLEQAAALAEPAISCDHASQEPHHDHPTTATPRPAPEAMARRPSGRGQPAGGLSRPGAGVHPEFHGHGERAGGAQGGGSPADSTRPLDATRELATAAGSLTYTQVSERLAAKVADCLDELLDADPEDIAITPDWLRELHRRIAGDLFPDWAGRFRSTDVQVGTHFPPPAHALAVYVRDFSLDLEERLRHLTGAESLADLLAWVDWRFQWIHPFKDFNGRVGRILLVALTYRLGLPPLDPAAMPDKHAYFAALRAADAGNLAPLQEIWLRRLDEA